VLKHQQGSLLIEALVSLLLITGGILALVSVAATAINQVSQTKYRNDASNFASDIISDMYSYWDSTTSLSAYVTNNQSAWQTRVASSLPSGNVSVTPHTVMTNSSPMYTVDIVISWVDKKDTSTPTAPTHQYLTTSVIAK